MPLLLLLKQRVSGMLLLCPTCTITLCNAVAVAAANVKCSYAYAAAVAAAAAVTNAWHQWPPVVAAVVVVDGAG